MKSMKADMMIREEEKRIENMQMKAKEQEEKKNMEVEMNKPILVKIVTEKGIPLRVELKGKCLQSVIENQQSKKNKEVQSQAENIRSREHGKYQNRMSAFHHMCEMGVYPLRQEWTENLVEFYLEWRKRNKGTKREGYREWEDKGNL